MTDSPETGLTPERAQRAARALFVLTPFSFVLCWVLAAVQGADARICLIISTVGMIMCLCAALLFKLRGSKAARDAVWIQALLAIIVSLIARR